jgi:hypothetical protein
MNLEKLIIEETYDVVFELILKNLPPDTGNPDILYIFDEETSFYPGIDKNILINRCLIKDIIKDNQLNLSEDDLNSKICDKILYNPFKLYIFSSKNENDIDNDINELLNNIKKGLNFVSLSYFLSIKNAINKYNENNSKLKVE